MAWQKLDNPKPSGNGAIGKDQVRVSAHAAAHNTRYIKFRVGSEIARKASLTHPQQKCHIVVGSDLDAGKLGIAVDDANGLFKAKRLKDGSYQITIAAGAAAGRFNLTFPPFTRDAKALAIGAGPAPIVFEATADFLGAAR